jgi:hypothetical protein
MESHLDLDFDLSGFLARFKPKQAQFIALDLSGVILRLNFHNGISRKSGNERAVFPAPKTPRRIIVLPHSSQASPDQHKSAG